MRNAISISMFGLAIALAGCERKPESPPAKPAPGPGPTTRPAPPDEHANGEAHGAHGEGIELGTAKIGGFDVRAARDTGELKAGGDAPIDVWLNGGKGEGVAAVRFWIGAADAAGSIKAKADIEENHWHTHVEVPDPLPVDATLWVEIEIAGGEKVTGAFDLKL